MKLKIYAREEYGFGHHIWTPSEQNFEKLQKLFKDRMAQIGYAANPQWVDPEGEWVQIFNEFPEEGDCERDYHPECKCVHCEGEWVDWEGNPVTLPDNGITCHIHEADDSYLEKEG